MGLGARIIIALRLLFLGILVTTLASGSPAPRAKTHLVIVGGGDRPAASNRKFFEWAGAKHANILVVSWGTTDSQEYYQAFADTIQPLGPSKIQMAPAYAEMPGKKNKFLEQVKEATGVWFTGGDQKMIMSFVRDQEIRDALVDKYRSGVVFGGTSAGCAIMADVMINGDGRMDVIDGNEVGVEPGLGLFSGPLIDQHFIARSRENRLFGLVLKFPDKLGIGIDESTAIAVEDGDRFTVIGNSYVMLVSSNNLSNGLSLQLLKDGDTYSIANRSPLSIASR
jgi:cyanophycinase